MPLGSFRVNSLSKYNIPTISEGWSLFNASYDNISFSVSSQSTSNTSAIRLSIDGSKMYIASDGTNSIFQYSLSTPWDISTASYSNKSFSVNSQESGVDGIFFKSDGTVLYIVGYNQDKVFQYSLSTAWDISTASYSNKSFSVASESGAPTDIHFKSDGSKMFMNNRDTTGGMKVFEYSLSTAWDISTASYSNKSFIDSTRDTRSRGFFIGKNGSRLYIVGDGNTNSIFQYSLSTPWDISTVTYDNLSLALDDQLTGPWGFDIKPDGFKLYAIGYSISTVYQYSLTS